MLDQEALALIARGFFRCYYVSLYCPNCGYVRWVTPQVPEGEYVDCPACTRPHCHSGVVGTGFTNKELPRHEIWWTPPVWIIAGDEAPDSAEPDPQIVAALEAGRSYPAVAEQFQISEKRALRIRQQSGLPGRQVHAR